MPKFDQDFWEQLWSKTLREHADKLAHRPPNAHLMAEAAGPGGTLFLVGHRPIDPSTGAATAAASQVQVSIEGAVATLDSNVWELVVVEERPRAAARLARAPVKVGTSSEVSADPGDRVRRVHGQKIVVYWIA